MLALALLVLQSPAAPAAAAPDDRAAEDRRALAAFAHLDASERKDFVDYLRLEIGQEGLFQGELVHFVLRSDARAPESFPEAHEPAFYDPAVHAPEQPTPRHPLAANDSRLREVREQFAGHGARRALDSAWSYDYARREVVRQRGWDDPARIVRNALAGYEPDYDRAEALVEAALDDGSQQKVFQAFGHAYTDRLGVVYTGVTLFDAWASGAEIEMPDVDTLGLYHDLRGDWSRFRAPVSNQGPLYEALGEYFREANRFRGLRHALALSYLAGRPELGTYAGMLENLHLAWEKARSTPLALVQTLPSTRTLEGAGAAPIAAPRGPTWQEYLDALVAEGREQPEEWAAAELRRDTLARAPDLVRTKVLEGLHAFGAYQKLERPPAPK
ncbi:MAG: hypothetical protein IPJ19_02225 [Planctomycetes bacterium]|nr:hypothetical protein [Planctomycetota bacterium]